MKRVFLIVLDSVGIGEMPDAAAFGDEGSNTLKAASTSQYFSMPNMRKLGLFNIDGVEIGAKEEHPTGAFARMTEQSMGKDTTIGHWEIAGIISESPLPTYPEGFPKEIIEEFSRKTGRGVLCNKPVTLGILAYLSGHVEFASYLNIMYIPNSEELVIFICAFVGALIGFLWYNAYPAQVFMGDTGSLMIGGVIAVSAIIIRKELLIPILCGIFLVESLSVIIQTSYFKYTKKKFGEGKRIFLMAPLHHHYQKKSIPESKIVARFWIIGMLLAMLTIVTLKIR